ncbi:Acyl-CoA transferases/carnitine dehydratase domain protein (plasmid) [Neorhizobium galegae bv. officinalis bv. officinalis str. HAMBI 1141]|uniref:DUF4387 domain-containing protein n=2 Tax=Neorhizobium galegae bv. officinalis TaxID=323656 RepID=A0A0T7G5N4_NEOGA|nr:DUF4387 domain-containing protein [Neorhizobium galegae]MCQ1766732.1 DUF4387 domain-containing protein [Neorhizobium galegae]MCQ1849465.1 DUF4387 domain-containing protein [Neorhizobium galegae]CDN58388.1 Acyl-CoA transferases/carnitine dehydratase domain protein [Neorhizobium galegae bv. officinalis bv. officinalis str. HAMBI 1141]CDZ30250.1 Hypothetical protein NGAL_HAMBI490_51180 [Neorhizobium galegae bv. officinalis]CDZ40686.1 Hypothetical protein NGAL_HAMBI1145_55200 [Neorhizobium gale
MTRLIDVASVIRSKNAGPYELTFDIIFQDRFWFEEAKRVNLINSGLICSLYGIEEKDVLDIIAFEPANAIKATIKRPLVSGAIGETDVYGAQQHAPLLSLKFGDD